MNNELEIGSGFFFGHCSFSCLEEVTKTIKNFRIVVVRQTFERNISRLQIKTLPLRPIRSAVCFRNPYTNKTQLIIFRRSMQHKVHDINSIHPVIQSRLSFTDESSVAMWTAQCHTTAVTDISIIGYLIR